MGFLIRQGKVISKTEIHFKYTTDRQDKKRVSAKLCIFRKHQAKFLLPS
jgi:hypothetical protein